jgi:hypothetical protein
LRKLALLAKALLGLSILAFSAKADPIPLPPELKAFLMRPDQQQGFIALMGQQWRAVMPNCASPQVKNTNVFISSPPTFDQAGAPTSGAWHVVSQVEGCSEVRVINIFYLFTKDGEMKRIAALPGTTIADLALQRDSLVYAAMGMGKISPKDCKDTKFTNTRFVGFGAVNPQAAPGRNNRAWTEEWTVQCCNVTGVVTMHFTPDATGTNISSFLNETRQVDP